MYHCLCDGFRSHVPGKLQSCTLGSIYFDIVHFFHVCKGWTFQVPQSTDFCQLPAWVQWIIRIQNLWTPKCRFESLKCVQNGSTWSQIVWHFQHLIRLAVLPHFSLQVIWNRPRAVPKQDQTWRITTLAVRCWRGHTRLQPWPGGLPVGHNMWTPQDWKNREIKTLLKVQTLFGHWRRQCSFSYTAISPRTWCFMHFR